MMRKSYMEMRSELKREAAELAKTPEWDGSRRKLSLSKIMEIEHGINSLKYAESADGRLPEQYFVAAAAKELHPEIFTKIYERAEKKLRVDLTKKRIAAAQIRAKTND